LIKLGSQQGGMGELRRLAETRNPTDKPIEFAIEQHDFTDLRRPTGRRYETATAALAELTGD